MKDHNNVSSDLLWEICSKIIKLKVKPCSRILIISRTLQRLPGQEQYWWWKPVFKRPVKSLKQTLAKGDICLNLPVSCTDILIAATA